MKTFVIFFFALAVVLFACVSPAAASDITIPSGETRYVDSGEILTINPGDTLTIESGGHLIVNKGGTIYNYGTIDNYCEFINWGTIKNCGTISNYYQFTNYGTINNGNIINNAPGDIHNFGTIENCGSINSPSHIPNYGSINNYEGGIVNCTSFSPNPVNNRYLPCPFSCHEEVPVLIPLGIIALVSLLSAVAAVTLVRKRR